MIRVPTQIDKASKNTEKCNKPERQNRDGPEIFLPFVIHLVNDKDPVLVGHAHASEDSKIAKDNMWSCTRSMTLCNQYKIRNFPVKHEKNPTVAKNRKENSQLPYEKNLQFQPRNKTQTPTTIPTPQIPDTHLKRCILSANKSILSIIPYPNYNKGLAGRTAGRSHKPKP
ncbi:hypothetical protein CHS0354_010039 [Potamilus streckersoni]|uniref:Uncharacterized protein n=1 Tax=Potamilus streckersoni TaxID=2493646 RepID=A0AAE0SCY0_9BIVA|nr:hypothetical protein CHS0354_010039 [Potamilus streckersoni]